MLPFLIFCSEFLINEYFYSYALQRYIPKNFEPAEMKKVKLQETMSGLKHDFSIENESNLLKASLEVADDESEIDPIDECKKLGVNGIESFGLT